MMGHTDHFFLLIFTFLNNNWCETLAKTTDFWSELMLSGNCKVAQWSREKLDHFWVKQLWDRKALG